MIKRSVINYKRLQRVRSRGSQIVEFAAAMVLLVCVILLPFLDLAILPVRWLMAQEIVNAYIRKLALCETFSEAYQIMEADPSLSTRLSRLGGIDCKSLKLKMRAARVFLHPHQPEVIVVERPGQMPPDWLPDGKKAPCIYTLEIEIKSLISPAVLVSAGGLSVPGITAPLPFVLSASHGWENLGRNPVTRRFFINE